MSPRVRDAGPKDREGDGHRRDGATKTAPATIEVTDANTAPSEVISAVARPGPARPADWRSGGRTRRGVRRDRRRRLGPRRRRQLRDRRRRRAVQRNHTFARSATYTSACASRTVAARPPRRRRTIHVVNAPPKAMIAGPGVIDLGSTAPTPTPRPTTARSPRAPGTPTTTALRRRHGRVRAGRRRAARPVQADPPARHRRRGRDDDGHAADHRAQPAGPVVISDPVAAAAARRRDGVRRHDDRPDDRQPPRSRSRAARSASSRTAACRST